MEVGRDFMLGWLYFILQIDDLNAQLAKQAKSAMVITYVFPLPMIYHYSKTCLKAA